jgi:hypothetical protein
MKFPLKLWLKWIALVLLSAIASFIAALMAEYNTIEHLAGIGLGIGSFIVIYTLVESWAVSRGKDDFVRSLKVGVVVKIGLELVPAIDVVTGAIAISVIDEIGIRQPVLATYLKTMLVGVMFSVVVFIIASLHSYLRAVRLRHGHVRGALQ